MAEVALENPDLFDLTMSAEAQPLLDAVKKHIKEIQENFSFQNIDSKNFIEMKWMSKYDDVLKYLIIHSNLPSHTSEYRWYTGQRKFLTSLYRIKRTLLDKIEEVLSAV